MIPRYLIFPILCAAIVSCSKEEPATIQFTPTDFIVGQMGPNMRISIDDPFSVHHAFTGDTSQYNYIGEGFHLFQVNPDEMNALSSCLSDTVIFNWEVTTASYPYPEDECKIRVDMYGYGDFMCTIGKGQNASDVIYGLSKSVSGDPKHALEDIAASLSSE